MASFLQEQSHAVHWQALPATVRHAKSNAPVIPRSCQNTAFLYCLPIWLARCAISARSEAVKVEID